MSNNLRDRGKSILNHNKITLGMGVLIIILTVGMSLRFAMKKDKVQKTGIEALWQNRTQYVGDNSAVGNIILGLSFPENMHYDGFELFTKEKPYGISINFKTDTETRNSFTDILNEAPFQRNAIILFSLIENAELIDFTLDDGKNPYLLDYTLGWAESIMKEERLFNRTETFRGFGELIKEISIKINAQIEDSLNSKNISDGNINNEDILNLMNDNLEKHLKKME